MHRNLAKKGNEDGFTLVELLIVIIILGILAAVVVFGVGAFKDDAIAKACKADVKSVETAAAAYRAKEGTFAADLNALTPTYLKSAPNSTDYHITYTPSASTFSVAGTKGTVADPKGAC